MTLRLWVYVLNKKLNQLKWVKKINLSKSLKKLNKSKLSKELNELKSMNNVKELEYIREIMIQSFSNSWIYSCKIYISSIYSWRRSRISLRIIWYFEVMNCCFSLREISYSKFINYWFFSRENFSSTQEYFLRIMIYFD